MIPILYDSTEQNFTNNGIGRLTNAISCTVLEERNGPFELEMQYPIDGLHYADITYDRLIYCRTCDAVALQPFRIYKISRPMSGIVTVYARHISYDLNKIVVAPFTEPSITQLFANLPSHAMNTCPFTFSTDKTVTADFNVTVPSSIRSLMGGSEGSILDVYGTGEYKYDKFNVYLYLHRGQDNGVTIRYGKNLTDLLKDEDGSGTVTAVVPYWQGPDGTVVCTEDPIYSGIGVADPYTDASYNRYQNGSGTEYDGAYFPQAIVEPLDLSTEFEEQPTVEQLQAAAESWLNSHASIVPDENVTVSFVHLWQTNEYENYAPLQRVNLCDTVTVIYTKLGVSVTAKVIKTVYDVLRERYNSMELGTPRTTLSDTIIQNENAIADVEKNAVTSTFMEQAIESATNLIAGGLGGHVVMNRNANGEPQEILIMDTDNIATAMNVIRMNQNGIGFSMNGYNGPFTTAWTIDGRFVADFITAGTLKTIMLQGPTSDTFWDLATGIFQNSGQTTVTAQVETSPGTFTPTTYTINHKTRIASGKLTVRGAQTGGAEVPYMDIGIAAEGMDYDFYEDASGNSGSTSYPYAGVNLYGDTVQGMAGANWQYDGNPATYTPAAHYTPDYIELGLAEDLSATGKLPDRNKLRLAAGWTNYNDAIVYQEFYTYKDTPSGERRQFKDSRIRRPSWEYADDDYVAYSSSDDARIICAGYITDSQQSLWFQIPLCRPFASNVVSVDIFGEFKARLEGSYIAGGASSKADFSDYTQKCTPNAAGLAVKLTKSNSGTWASGNNNHAVVVDLYGFGFNCYSV